MSLLEPGTGWRGAGCLVLLGVHILTAQSSRESCVQPLCVNRTDDSAKDPLPGMLRYAVNKAPNGAVITFDRSLNGKVLELDLSSPANHLRISRDLSIEGPGSDLLTISGGKTTRIFFIAAGTVQISGLTLANGLGKGGDGGSAAGGAGGGGGGAGFGGAIFLSHGSLMLNAVVIRGNRALGGSGGASGQNFSAGRGGGGGGFAGSSVRTGIGGAGGDLENTGDAGDGTGGPGGVGDRIAGNGGEGGWGGGGGGGGVGLQDGVARGAMGGPSLFAGGVGGAGGFFDAEAGTELPGGGGCGGSALGGAVFVSSGLLHMNDTVFLDNTSVAGLGAAGAVTGVAKGGALFICTPSYCGPGHDGIAVLSGNSGFKGSSAADSGADQVCSSRDDADVCGPLTAPPKGNDSKL
jgi:hypothetical protein